MPRTLTKIACLALLALPLALPAHAGSGGPNPPEMSGNSPARAASWQDGPWSNTGEADGLMSKGKKSKTARAMCEKIRAEYSGLEMEKGALRLQCDGARGLDRLTCDNKMEALEARQDALHVKMSAMHDKMSKHKKPARKMKKLRDSKPAKGKTPPI